MDIRQVVNALELMEFFAERGRPASLAEVAKHFDWPRSSTFNLIGTLVSRGYLFEPMAKQGYYPSPKWLPMMRKIEQSAPVPSELQALVSALARRTNETAVLAAVSGMKAVFIATEESPQAVRYTAHVGKLVPLHATATGRALLAQMSDADRASVLRRTVFEQFTQASPMSVEAVERDIEKSRAQGFFEGIGGFSQDLGGYALPLSHQDRRFALLVGGPLVRVAPRREEILIAMREEMARYVPDALRAGA